MASVFVSTAGKSIVYFRATADGFSIKICIKGQNPPAISGPTGDGRGPFFGAVGKSIGYFRATADGFSFQSVPKWKIHRLFPAQQAKDGYQIFD